MKDGAGIRTYFDRHIFTLEQDNLKMFQVSLIENSFYFGKTTEDLCQRHLLVHK